MTILVTGSTGKTPTRLARLLQASNHPFVLATRRDPSEIPFPSTKLDWFDPTTFESALTHDPQITAIYVVPPETFEPSPIVNDFLSLAVTKGIKKFVFLAGTTAVKGGPYVGGVWAHLDSLAESDKDVEYAVLRPTWFMENFSEGQHPQTIKEEGIIYTSGGDGRAPFISADDIAAFAHTVLTQKIPYGNKDYLLLGPELLSNDEVAAIFTKVLGREIKHVRKTTEEMVEQYKKVGIKELYVNVLPILEGMLKTGFEEQFVDQFEAAMGRKGILLEEWVKKEAGKGFWG